MEEPQRQPPASGYVDKPVAPMPTYHEPVVSEADGDLQPEPPEMMPVDEGTHYASPTAQLEVLGFIDGVDAQGRLKGWACVKDRLDQRVEVEIYDGTDLLGMGTANQFRKDLSDAKLSDGASGFEVPLPPSLLEGACRSLVIRCEATQARPLVLRHTIGVVTEPPDPKDKATATTNSHLVRVKPVSGFSIEGPQAQASLYVAGQYIVTRAPYPAPPYHVSGWHDPEPDFTWIRGYEATIEMYIRSPRRSYIFSIEVIPNGITRQVQTLEIFFNRQRLTFREVPHAMTVSVEVPREVFTSRISVLNLHCRNAIVGSDFGSPDNRRLGIAVRSWQLV
jgi:hypothetical protein